MDKQIVYNYDYEQINYPEVQKIAGFDEAGRGAIAGPIVVAAVILPLNFKSNLIKDSKKLTFKQRDVAYQLIIEQSLDYAITVIDLEVIETNNPKIASVIGMEIAFQSLSLTPNICLIDFEKPNFPDFAGIIESIIKGDQKSINIAAASILAKVFRDRIMIDYHQVYPDYQFDVHKGYYTKVHAENLKKYGISAIHRKDYIVLSSDGHIRDLATKGKYGLGINFDDYTPIYKTPRARMPIIRKLKAAAKKASHIYLATDHDREGEAIAYHLDNVLETGLKSSRVTFNEITKDAILLAIDNNHKLDLNLVHSQQARQMLDRVIGFRLSNLLQKKIGSRSAGRVQSVALKLLTIREREIANFISEEFWIITSHYQDFVLTLEKYNNEPIRIANETEAKAIKVALSDNYKVISVTKQSRKRNSLNPLTTSTMLQAATKLNFTTLKTTFIAQQLYEGIEINEIEFKGFLIIDDSSIEKEVVLKLPDLKESETIITDQVQLHQNFTKPKPRYSEARLIKTLEDLGIGRPSTYSLILNTIKVRGYVVLENKAFKVTEKGLLTNDKLQEFFYDIINENYTSQVETQLDSIAQVDKPAYMTSHDCLAILKQKLKVKKIGHTGTLDPIATGLMVVLINEATKSLLDLDQALKIIENGNSYQENAFIKAKALSDFLKSKSTDIDAIVIGDDTGLEIEALDNFPGIFSERWKGDMSFHQAMQVILDKLANQKNRKAKMITAIVCIDNKNKVTKTFIGQLEGFLVFMVLKVTKRVFLNKEESLFKTASIGFIGSFTDTIGIGSFAVVAAGLNATKSVKNVKNLPGTLNIGLTVPNLLAGTLFVSAIQVELATLISLVVAAMLGSFCAAKIVNKVNRMETIVAFPIMTCAGGFALPTTALTFHRDNNYSPKVSYGLLIGGVLGTVAAFFIVFVGIQGGFGIKMDRFTYYLK
ncbi:dna topoisomerase i [Lasius niger]|uniref:Ribonuclease n=1 Tax=Lasius niger TaxID=67767 RepID=A0A0J7KZN3_LASNI|nr:dna topoisomerase i [Lasius niger]